MENSVFSHKIGGENGIISKKLHSGNFGIFYPAITSLVETGLKLTQKFFKSATELNLPTLGDYRSGLANNIPDYRKWLIFAKIGSMLTK